MSKQYIIKSHSAKLDAEVFNLTGGIGKSGQPLVITVKGQRKFELIDAQTQKAPHNIRVRRMGDDLVASFEGEDIARPDVVLKDFYREGGAELIGQAENGRFYEYVPETANTADHPLKLVNDGVSGLALGGEGWMAPWIPWQAVAGAASAVNPLAYLVPLALAGGGGGGGGSSSAGPKAVTEVKVTVDLPDVNSGNVRSVKIAGTTSGVLTGTVVTLVVTDSAGNTVTVTAITGIDGTYSTQADLSSLVSGPLVVNASSSGATGEPVSAADTSVLAVPPGVLGITILDGNDGSLNAGEVAAGVKANITLPADAKAGDTVKVDSNGDGIADVTVVLSAADINAGLITVSIAPAHVPAQGTLNVTATLTNAAGLESPAAQDSSLTDTTPPALSGQAFSYPENLDANSLIGVVALDDPADVEALGFQWTDGTLHGTSQDGYYAIAPDGSVTLTVAGAAALTNDFDSGAPVHTYTLAATDRSGNVTTSVLTLTETNINEAPGFTSTPPLSVADNTPAGTVIYSAGAQDVDAGDTRTYALSGPDADKFIIDAQTGEVRLVEMADFQSQTSYTFTVTVTDAGGLTDSQIVTLGVDNAAQAASRMGVATLALEPTQTTVAGETVTLQFELVRTASTGAASVDWTLSGLAASDFPAGLPTGTASFADGQSSVMVSVTVPASQTLEATRTATLSLNNPSSGYVIDPDNQSAQAEIIDASGIASGAAVNFAVVAEVQGIASEGSLADHNTLVYHVTRSGDTSQALTIAYHLTPSGAAIISGEDFGDGSNANLPSGTITFAAGSATADIVLPVRGDNAVGPDESFNLVLGDSVSSTVFADGARVTGITSGTILNDDAYVTVSSQLVGGQEPGSVTHQFILSLTGATNIAHTVSYNLVPWGEQGAVDLPASLLQALSGTVTFAPGETQKVVSFDPVAFPVIAGYETFSIQVQAAPESNVSLLNDTALSSLVPNLQEVTVTAQIDRALEGTASDSAVEFVYIVTRTGVTDLPATLQWSLAGIGESAAQASDFAGGAYPSGTLVFAAGETSKEIRFKPAEDSLLEGEEGFALQINANVPSVRVLTPVVEGVIVDDESALGFDASTVFSASEGDSGARALIVTVTRIGFSGSTSSVEWRVTPGSIDLADLIPGQDLLGNNGGYPSGVLTLNPGEVTGSVSLRVAGDSVLEAHETLTVTLANPSAGTKLLGVDTNLAGYGHVATATIVNDDAIISVRDATVSQIEGQGGTSGFMAITVVRQGSTVGADSVRWTLQSSATQSADLADLGLSEGSGLAVFNKYQSSWIDVAELSGTQSASGTVTLPHSGYVMVAYNRDQLFADPANANTPFDQLLLRNLSISGGGTLTALGSVDNSNFIADNAAIGDNSNLVFSGNVDLPPGGRHVVLSSTQTLGDVYFVVTGTDANGQSIQEQVRGPQQGSVATSQLFSTVTSVETLSASVSVGLAYDGHLGNSNSLRDYLANIPIGVGGGQAWITNEMGDHSVWSPHHGALDVDSSIHQVLISSQADLTGDTIHVVGGIRIAVYDQSHPEFWGSQSRFYGTQPSWQTASFNKAEHVRAEQVSGATQDMDGALGINYFLVTGLTADGERLSELLAVPDFVPDNLAQLTGSYAGGAELLSTPVVMASAGRVFFSGLQSPFNGNGQHFTVTGTDVDGNVISETIAAIGGDPEFNFGTARVFQSVTSITSDASLSIPSYLNIGSTVPVETTHAFVSVVGVAPVDSLGQPLLDLYGNPSSAMEGRGRVEFSVYKEFDIAGGVGTVVSDEFVNFVSHVQVITSTRPEMQVDVGFEAGSNGLSSNDFLTSALGTNTFTGNFNPNLENNSSVGVDGKILGDSGANMAYAIFKVDASSATPGQPVTLSFDLAALGRLGIDTSTLSYAPSGTWSTDLSHAMADGSNLLIPILTPTAVHTVLTMADFTAHIIATDVTDGLPPSAFSTYYANQYNDGVEHTAAAAFDNNAATTFVANGARDPDLTINLGAAKVVTSMSLSTGTSANWYEDPAYDPAHYQIWGTNDPADLIPAPRILTFEMLRAATGNNYNPAGTGSFWFVNSVGGNGQPGAIQHFEGGNWVNVSTAYWSQSYSFADITNGLFRIVGAQVQFGLIDRQWINPSNGQPGGERWFNGFMANPSAGMTLISEGELAPPQTPDSNGSYADVSFTNTNAYQYYRVVFDKHRYEPSVSDNWYDWTSIGEVSLRGPLNGTPEDIVSVVIDSVQAGLLEINVDPGNPASAWVPFTVFAETHGNTVAAALINAGGLRYTGPSVNLDARVVYSNGADDTAPDIELNTGATADFSATTAGQIALSGSGYIWIRHANGAASADGTDQALINSLFVDNGATLSVVGQKVITDGVANTQSLGAAGELELNGSAVTNTNQVIELPAGFNGSLMVYVSPGEGADALRNGTYTVTGTDASGNTVVVTGQWQSTAWGATQNHGVTGESVMLSGLDGLRSIQSVRISEYSTSDANAAGWGNALSPNAMSDITVDVAAGNLTSLASQSQTQFLSMDGQNYSTLYNTYFQSDSMRNTPGAPMYENWSWDYAHAPSAQNIKVTSDAAELFHGLNMGQASRLVIGVEAGDLSGREFVVTGQDANGNPLSETITVQAGTNHAYTNQFFMQVDRVESLSGVGTGYINIDQSYVFTSPTAMMAVVEDGRQTGSFVITGFDEHGDFKTVVVDDLRANAYESLGLFSEVIDIQASSGSSSIRFMMREMSGTPYSEYVDIDLNSATRGPDGMVNLGSAQHVVIGGFERSANHSFRVTGLDEHGNLITEVIDGVASGYDSVGNQTYNVNAVTTNLFTHIQSVQVSAADAYSSGQYISVGTLTRLMPTQSVDRYGAEIVLGDHSAQFESASLVTFSSAENLTDRIFTITGIRADGTTVTEQVTGPNQGMAVSAIAYRSITSIAVDDGATGSVKVGYTTTQGGLVDNFQISGSGTASDPFVGHSTNPLEAAYANGEMAGNAAEGDILLYVDFNGAAGGTVNLHYDLSIQGSGGQDALYIEYSSDVVSLLQGTAYFADGQSETTILIPVRGDDTREANENVVLTLTSSSSGTTINQAANTTIGTIINDDDLISMSAAASAGKEGHTGNGYVDFIVTRADAGPAKTLSWHLAGLDETPTSASASDFAALTGTVTFIDGATTAVLRVAIAGDRSFEADESFRVILDTPSVGSGYSLGSVSSANGVILNDDVSVTLSAATANVLEGHSGLVAHTFTVTRTGDLDQTTELDWTVTGLSSPTSLLATGADFPGAALPSGTVSFAAGAVGSQNTDTQTITVYTNGDTTMLGDRSFAVSVSNATGNEATILTAQAHGKIIEDDAIVVSVDPLGQLEGTEGVAGAGPNTLYPITLTRGGDLSRALTLDWTTVLQSGSGFANAADFAGGTLPSGQVTFAAGSATATVNIAVSADSAIELDESFNIHFSAHYADSSIAVPQDTTVQILGDDIGVAVQVAPQSVPEGHTGTTPIDVTFIRVGGTTLVTSYNWNVRGMIDGSSTAAVNGDFTGATSGMITFGVGENSKTITLNINGDSIYSANKTFVVDLSDLAATATVSSPTVTIVNDDARLTVQVDKATFSEGSSGSGDFELVTYTISREGNVDQAGTVDWKILASAGIAAGDFVGGSDALGTNAGLPSGTVSFAAGAASATVTLQVARDSNFEADESLQFQLLNASVAHQINGTGLQTSTIVNDDALVQFASGSLNVVSGAEGNHAKVAGVYNSMVGNADEFTTVTFTVERTGDFSHSSSAHWNLVLDGTAVANDFTGATSGDLSFAAGSTASQVITLQVRRDLLAEGDETFHVALSSPDVGTSIAANSVAAGTLLDDDIGVKLDVGQNTTLVRPEGQSGTTPYTWTLVRSGDLSQAVDINWTVSGNGFPAADASDFVATSGVVHFAANQTSAALTVLVAGDTVIENNEYFKVALTASANVSDFAVNGNALSYLNGSGPQYLYGTIMRDEGEFNIVNEQASATDFTNLSVATAKPEGDTGDLVSHFFKIYRNYTSSGDATVDWKVLNTATTAGTDVQDYLTHPLTTGVTLNDFQTGDLLGSNGGMPSGTAVIPDGQDFVVIEIVTHGNLLGEDNKAFNVVLSNAQAGNNINQWLAVGYIGNDDTVFSVGQVLTDAAQPLSYGSRVLNEGDGVVVYRVYRSGDASLAAEVDWAVTFPNPVTAGASTNNYTASAADFDSSTHPLSGSLSFAAGETYKDVTLQIADDILTESVLESFNITLSNAHWASGVSTSRTVSVSTIAGNMESLIVDNDVAGSVVSVAVSSNAVSEGTGGSNTITYTLTRTGDLSSQAQVGWGIQTQGGYSDIDIASITGDTGAQMSWGNYWSGLVTFGVGESSKTITVNVSTDSVIEANETLGFSLVDAITILNQGNLANTPQYWNYGHDGAVNSGIDNGIRLDDSTWIPDSGNMVINPAAAQINTLLNNDDTHIRVNNVNIAGGIQATVYEGSSGTVDLVLNLTRYGRVDTDITVNYEVLANGSADGSDIVIHTGTLTLSAGTMVSGNDSRNYSFNLPVILGDTAGELDETFTVRLSGSSDANATFSQAASGGAGATSVDVPVLLLNDDTSWSISADPLTTTQFEGQSGFTNFVFTVTRPVGGNNYSGAAIVNWAVVGNGAHQVDAADFENGVMPAGYVSFAAGQSSQQVSIRVRGDSLAEYTEAFQVALTGADRGLVDSTPIVMTVRNDDTGIMINDVTTVEGDSGVTNMTFTVTRVGLLTDTSSAKWSILNGNTIDSDFAAGTQPGVDQNINFAANAAAGDYNQESQTITVSVVGDQLAESTENFSVQLSNLVKVNDQIDLVGAGTILNDDANFSIEAGPSVVEGASPGQMFTITRSHSTTQSQTVTWTVSSEGGSHGAAGDDFVGGAFPSQSLVFLPGELSKTIFVASNGDSAVEVDETFSVTLTAGAGVAPSSITTATAYGMIVNDDSGTSTVVPDSWVSISNATPVVEGQSGTTQAVFTVTRTGALGFAATVHWQVMAAGTASDADASDMGGVLASGTLNLLPNQTSYTINVPISGDSLLEGDESFKVVLDTPSAGLALGATTEASGVILNDDSLISLSDVHARSAPDMSSVAEGSGSTPNEITFTVTRSGNTSAAGSANWDITSLLADQTGTGDLVLSSGTVQFAAGETSKVITVQVVGDAVAEMDEFFQLSLSNAAAGSTINAAAASTFFKVINDDAETFTLSTGSSNVSEGNPDPVTGNVWQEISFTATRENALAPGSVDWAVAGTGAYPMPTDLSHFSALTGTVNFATGELSKTFTIAVLMNTVGDFDRTFGVTLGNAVTSSTVGANLPAPATVTVLNEDPAFALDLLPEATSGANQYLEGTGALGTLVQFKVTRSGSTVGTASVDWHVEANGTNAANLSDFGGFWPSGSVGFVDGESEKIVQFRVAGDRSYEANEGFKVVIDNAVGANILAGLESETGVIRNDDVGVSVSTLTPVVNEGDVNGNQVDFRITAIGLAGQTVTVNYVYEGSGINPAGVSDLTGALSGTVTLTIGSSGSTSQDVSAYLHGDILIGSDETFRLRVTTTSSGSVVGTGMTEATIANDDSLVAISPPTLSQAEGNSGTTDYAFTVTRTGDLSRESVVDYVVEGMGDNPANAADFGGAYPAGTVVFAAGQSTAVVYVAVATDTVFESSEDFGVRLVTATGPATVGRNVADIDPSATLSQATIVNDDLANIELRGIVTSVAEGSDPAQPRILSYEVVRNGDSSQALTATYEFTADGVHAAPAGSTFVNGLTGSFTFAAGQSRTILNIEVAGNTTANADQYFNLGVSAPGFGLPAAVAGSVLDDDSGIAIAGLSLIQAEGHGGTTSFEFTVTRSGSATAATDVAWELVGAGEDQASVSDFLGGVMPSGMLNFASGEMSKTITIAVNGDTMIEPNESFRVNLLSSSDASQPILVGHAVATISNDEVVTNGNDVIYGSQNADLIEALDGDDFVQGGAGADQIYGGAGNDILHGGGGSDLIYGGAGDDSIALTADNLLYLQSSTPTALVDGGSGLDTLVLEGAGMNLNLSTLSMAQLINVEAVDLTGTGANTLNVNSAALASQNQDMFSVPANGAISFRQLLVTGDANDTVVIDDASSFTATGTFAKDGHTYNVYSNVTQQVQLLVDQVLLVA